ncbi:TolC family protein [Marinilabilia rubra]|uniref:Transporter n=1 Tax=Marinilabilia rubra TaxID=2162893 RepID=A0A2U2B5U5_9BACT|nr:TolC family protein [Marinilabilia rubra]PWD98450.1 hypothetical protein DDZ16_15330 [Marinilabilia rubra]
MKKFILLILLIGASASVHSQALTDFLLELEENNPQLIALQKWLNAEATKAKTGIYPDNPEVSYSYLTGSPEAIGNQEEFEVSQSFKLPGYYTSKSAIQQLGYEQKKVLVEKRKREILHSARKAWFNLIWLHKKENLLKTRNQNAKELVALIKKGFDGGEMSKPVYDKARIFAITIQNEWRKTKTEIDITRHQLEALNGMQSIPETPKEYPFQWQLPDMDSILNTLTATHPELIIARLNIKQSEEQIKHRRLESWPSFNAGFKSETILDQKLQGFHAGISIPLWQNTNKVKYAKLKVDQEKARFMQKEYETMVRFRKLHNEVRATWDNYLQMRSLMDNEEASAASLVLLESGHISFAEYMMDLEMIYDSKMTFLRNEKDYFVGLSQLKVFRKP